MGHLSIAYNNLGTLGTVAISNSENFAKLSHLWIQQNSIKEDGVYNLVMSDYFTQLIHLDMSQNGIGNTGVQSLAIGLVNRLKYLNISHNDIGEDGFRILSESQNFQVLNELEIYNGHHVSAKAKNALKRSKNLQALRFIS